MTARGDIIRSHEVFPVHGLREAEKGGAERQPLRDKAFILLVALAVILGVGLIVYGFHEALETMEMGNLPPYASPRWPLTF
jgi:hypothetical protein